VDATAPEVGRDAPHTAVIWRHVDCWGTSDGAPRVPVR